MSDQPENPWKDQPLAEPFNTPNQQPDAGREAASGPQDDGAADTEATTSGMPPLPQRDADYRPMPPLPSTPAVPRENPSLGNQSFGSQNYGNQNYGQLSSGDQRYAQQPYANSPAEPASGGGYHNPQYEYLTGDAPQRSSGLNTRMIITLVVAALAIFFLLKIALG